MPPLCYYGINRFWYADLLSEPLVELARVSARAVRRSLLLRPRVRKWQTPRAGPDTPLWNTLARAAEAHLRRREAKAALARLLGVSRQRLHLLVVARTAYPDAERTLLLLVWLQARMHGRDLSRLDPQRASARLSAIK